jgi:S1-C subfamily serine protease
LWTLGVLAITALVIALIQLSFRVDRLQAAITHAAPKQGSLPPPKPIIPRGDLSQAEQATVALFSERSSAVVHITTVDMRSDAFRMNVLEVPHGSGSGFVWDDAGHVVTNLHVIQGADRARVTLWDRTTFEARLVGASQRNDLAVLSIESKSKLVPITLGSSHDLQVGQQVFAIGSPFGLDYTLSTGIISGLGREIPSAIGVPIKGAIQTDAAINPGNSGGPLLDSSGRMIGVNTSIISPSGASAGIGFAVPADTVARVVPQLIQYGREIRPMLGVELAEDALMRRIGLEGALVLGVSVGSPAEKAGIVATKRDGRSGRIVLGDVIVAFDDEPIHKSTDVYLALEKHKEGDRVQLTVSREGQARKVEVVLALNVSPATPFQP